MDVEYKWLVIITREKLSSIYVANMELIYWPVRLSIRGEAMG